MEINIEKKRQFTFINFTLVIDLRILIDDQLKANVKKMLDI